MTHLPFIAASYGITIAAILFLAIACTIRLGRARRLLAAAETARPQGRR